MRHYLTLACALLVNAGDFNVDLLMVYGVPGTARCHVSPVSPDGKRVWVACSNIKDDEKAAAVVQFHSGPSSDVILIDATTDGIERKRYTFGSPLREIVWGIDVNWAKEEVFVTGATAGTWDNQARVSNNTLMDAFLTKYKFDGTRSWTRIFGTSKSDHGRAVAVDTVTDNVFVCGWVNATDDFNLGVAGSSRATPFAAQFSAATGATNWITYLSFSGYQNGCSLVPSQNSPASNLVIGGYKIIAESAYWSLISSQGSVIASAELANCEPQRVRYDPSISLIVSTGWITPAIDGTTPFGGQDAWITYFNPNDLTRVPASVRVGSDKTDTFMSWLHDPETKSVYTIGMTTGNLTGPYAGGGSDLFLIKFHADGSLDWQFQLGSEGTDAFHGWFSLANGRLVFGVTFMDAGAYIVYKVRDFIDNTPVDPPLALPSSTPGTQQKPPSDPSGLASEWTVIGAAGGGAVLLAIGVAVFVMKRRKSRMVATTSNVALNSRSGSRNFFSGNEDW